MASATKPSPSPPSRSKASATKSHGSENEDLFTTLARTGLFLESLQRDCLGQHGLTFTEFSVLRLLARAPKRRLAPTALAEEIVCTTGAMTKLVDRLQRNDLVERTPDPDDRRGVLVAITRKGLRLSNNAANSYQTSRQRVLGRLGVRDAEEIHLHLIRLLEALESDKIS